MRVPLAWIGSRILGLNGVFWAGLIANVIAGISAYTFLYRKVCRVQSAYGPDIQVSKSEYCTDDTAGYPEN